ncbi:MAG TPA: DinB family protein [Pyrinomonadaceae bacterium]|nr:DinB family protein [Pyrinomonadaceae bacterium]
MGIGEPLAAELKHEAATTRRLLERVPEDKLGWKPHEKSMTLGRLAGHVAELPSLLGPVLRAEELDFASGEYKPFNATSVAEILERFDKNIADGIEGLKGLEDARAFERWRLRSGDHVIAEQPRAAIVRGLVLNHVLHHRGQLSVYLRLLDVPLPPIYGPTADEPM